MAIDNQGLIKISILSLWIRTNEDDGSWSRATSHDGQSIAKTDSREVIALEIIPLHQGRSWDGDSQAPQILSRSHYEWKLIGPWMTELKSWSNGLPPQFTIRRIWLLCHVKRLWDWEFTTDDLGRMMDKSNWFDDPAPPIPSWWSNVILWGQGLAAKNLEWNLLWRC